MTIKENIIKQINHRFFKHTLGDFDEQTIYNFVTNYLVHHGNKLPSNFDFTLTNNETSYDIEPMNVESKEFLNQNFISNTF